MSAFREALLQRRLFLRPKCGLIERRCFCPRGRPLPLLQASNAGSEECVLDNCGGSGGGGRPGCKHLGGNDDEQGPLPGRPELAWPVLLCFLGLSAARPAHALLGMGKKKSKKPPSGTAEVDKLVDLSWPILKNLGFSGIIGVVAAVALKTAGRSLAVAVGIVFSIVQIGAYLGYVSVDWARVHRDVIKSFDVNYDGKFDATDLKAISASLVAVLSQGVPSVGGFCAGFTWGLSL